MVKIFTHLMLFILVSLSLPLFAEEGFIGENPGLDFYSKIDEGQYSVLRKSVNRKLLDNPMLNTFGKKCLADPSVLNGIPTTAEMLDNIENGNWGEFTKLLNENLKKDKQTLSTDAFSKLTICLSNEYKKVKAQTQVETDARINISYLGLYMDGDKNNSDYDIITDIEKINAIIFSQDLKYNGSANQSGKGLKDFLANKAVAPLFPLSSSASSSANTPQANPLPGNTTSNPTNRASQSDMNALLGGNCTTMTPTGSVSSMVDETFLTELSSVLVSGGGQTTGVGNTPNTVSNPLAGSTSNATSNLTSAGDFFHEMPCTSIFCIKVKMTPGSTNLLGGGKNKSIEGILDKHQKIIEHIAASALGCEVMTNASGEFPKKKLDLYKTMAGGKIYLMGGTQKTLRDKREATPAREAQELIEIRQCAYALSGLPIDMAAARSMGGAGYNTTIGRSSENVGNSTVGLGPQETPDIGRFTNCINGHMQQGRRSYYDSFSTDVTEIQAYTSTMLDQIKNIVSVLTLMNDKRTSCK